MIFIPRIFTCLAFLLSGVTLSNLRSGWGHLALLSGYTPTDPHFDPPDVTLDTTVRGVISYYGPADLRAQFERFNELPGLTGKTRFERRFKASLS